MQEKSNADWLLDRTQARMEQDEAEGIVRSDADPVQEITMLTVNGVPRHVLDELNALAFRSGTSASSLGLLAIEQLLARAKADATALPPKRHAN